jgi:hypothetical protein
MPKIPWWVWALGLGGVGYLLYKSFSGAAAAVGAGATVATNAVSSGVADLWLSLPLVGLPPQVTVLGSIQLPNGGLVPLSSLQPSQIRNGPDGTSVLANVSGNIYQLSPSNTQGNYPATLIGPAPAGS